MHRPIEREISSGMSHVEIDEGVRGIEDRLAE